MKRPGITESRLVQAAAELADDNGLASVTISALARHFEVRPASIYSHVANLDTLLDLTALSALDEIAGRLAEALPGKAGRSALLAFANTHRDYAHTHPGRWQAAQRRLSPTTVAASAGSAHGGGRAIARSARAIMSGYGLTPTDETHAVRFLGGTINGFIALEAGGGFDHSNPTPDASWNRILDAVDASLRHWPHTPTD